jgi:hypothetical protein
MLDFHRGKPFFIVWFKKVVLLEPMEMELMDILDGEVIEFQEKELIRCSIYMILYLENLMLTIGMMEVQAVAIKQEEQRSNLLLMLKQYKML